MGSGAPCSLYDEDTGLAVLYCKGDASYKLAEISHQGIKVNSGKLVVAIICKILHQNYTKLVTEQQKGFKFNLKNPKSVKILVFKRSVHLYCISNHL